MASEKMKILKMLEEGRITADEAAKLMEATDISSEMDKIENKSFNQKFDNNQRRQESNYTRGQGQEGQSQGQHQSQGYQGQQEKQQYQGQQNQYQGQKQGFDDFANDLGRKFNTFAKDMEPKIQKFTESVVETTTNIADNISKSLQDSKREYQKRERDRQERARYEASRPATPKTPSNSYSKNFELMVEEGFPELNISGLNGDIMVNGYNGDKITAKVFYKPKHNNAQLELMKLGDKYYLNYDEDEFQFVTVEAFVPDSLFRNIKIETINGRITVSSIITDNINIIGINSKANIQNIEAKNINIDCSNGEMELFNIVGEKAQIEMFNGNINITRLDIGNLDLSANNGSIVFNMDYFRMYNDYTWILDTSNGKFTMNLPSSPELGYHIKAGTSLNTVKVGLTELELLMDNPTFVEAKTYDFDNRMKKIKIKAETSNAPLVIM